MKVILTSFLSTGKGKDQVRHQPGDEIDLPDKEAKQLLEERGAKPVPELPKKPKEQTETR